MIIRFLQSVYFVKNGGNVHLVCAILYSLNNIFQELKAFVAKQNEINIWPKKEAGKKQFKFHGKVQNSNVLMILKNSF